MWSYSPLSSMSRSASNPATSDMPGSVVSSNGAISSRLKNVPFSTILRMPSRLPSRNFLNSRSLSICQTGDSALDACKPMRAARKKLISIFDFQHVGQRMCRIGGHEQRRLARMARSQVQRQRAGDGRLPYTAFSDDKSQLSHREIVCGEPFLPQIYADERRLKPRSQHNVQHVAFTKQYQQFRK